MSKEKKFTLVDRLDVFKNKIRRNAKHLFVPMIFGVIGAIFISYFIATYFPSDNFNTLYITGLWDTSLAQFHGQEFVHTNNQELSVNQALNYFLTKTLDNVTWILIIFAISFVVLSAIVFHIIMLLADIHSEKDLEDQNIKGTKIISESQLADIQKEKGVQGAPVGNIVKFDRKVECNHTFISGQSGSGKTVILKNLYESLQANNPDGRFLIHDTKPEWIQEYYNPETDFIFDFSDQRSINFNIFSMINLDSDIDNSDEIVSIVASLIPETSGNADPIWLNVARDILLGCIYYCIENDKTNNLEIKKLVKLPVDQLATKLKGVEGAEVGHGHLTSGESQAANFMSTFRDKARFFTTFPDSLEGNELDIREWLENKKGGQSTIFLLNKAKTKDLNSIRIGAFVDSMINTLLDLPQSQTRRVYFFLDEIGSLSKMDSLIDGITKARSYGGAFIMGIQEYGRFIHRYGKELASTLINSTDTKFILKSGDPDTQDFCSRLIGKGKVKSTTITNSTGSEIGSNREGASFGSTEKIEEAVIASEFGLMKSNSYYYKNGSEIDWAFIQKDFTKEEIEIFMDYDKLKEGEGRKGIGHVPRKKKVIIPVEDEDSSTSSDDETSSNSSTGGQSLEEETTKETSTDEKKEEKVKEEKSFVRETEEISFGL